MKILEVNVDDIGHGGVYSFVINLLKNKKSDFKLDFCAFEQFESQEHIKEIESYGSHVYYVIGYGNKIKRLKNSLRELEKLVSQQEYDIAHIHSDVAYKLWLYAKICRKAGVKVVMIHSHSSGVDHGHRLIKNLLHKISKPKLKYLADYYLACSDKAAEWMYEKNFTNNVSIINNGINVNRFKYDESVRREYRKSLSLENKVVIGHVGRFDYQKNHDFLIDVFSEFITEIPEAVLLLIGDGNGKGRIQKKVSELGLNSQVIFYGVTNKVEKLLQAMDLFILPSHFEGLPISGVEAQASGLPIIFSDKISRNAKLINCVKFVSIDGSPKEWIDPMKELLKYPREDTSKMLIDKGYDNNLSIRKLEDLYLSAVNWK